jgi:VanZ family protein
MRKLGHLTAYAVLGLCWYLPLSRRLGGWCRRPALVVMALCVAYAALDEWHQSFVPGRTASPGDVLIDGVGAALAQMALLRKHRE